MKKQNNFLFIALICIIATGMLNIQMFIEVSQELSDIFSIKYDLMTKLISIPSLIILLFSIPFSFFNFNKKKAILFALFFYLLSNLLQFYSLGNHSLKLFIFSQIFKGFATIFITSYGFGIAALILDNKEEFFKYANITNNLTMAFSIIFIRSIFNNFNRVDLSLLLPIFFATTSFLLALKYIPFKLISKDFKSENKAKADFFNIFIAFFTVLILWTSIVSTNIKIKEIFVDLNLSKILTTLIFSSFFIISIFSSMIYKFFQKLNHRNLTLFSLFSVLLSLVVIYLKLNSLIIFGFLIMYLFAAIIILDFQILLNKISNNKILNANLVGVLVNLVTVFASFLTSYISFNSLLFIFILILLLIFIFFLKYKPYENYI